MVNREQELSIVVEPDGTVQLIVGSVTTLIGVFDTVRVHADCLVLGPTDNTDAVTANWYASETGL